jgi:predicted ATPase/tRNA A-37 threonylcarbamoyl transferase component Bud32
LRVLGQGGTARVFSAELIGPAGFRKRVALKVLRPHHRDKGEMLLREARLVARLHHPHIAQVFDVGEEDGRAFVAMELIDGLSVRQLLRRHRALPPGAGLQTLRQMCEALEYAHSLPVGPEGQGVVHRDVKPGNVLVDGWGQVKLVDFGIATALGGADGEEGPGWGTPGYAAPEQWEGGPKDHRIDLFALGVVGVELVLGRRPWRVSEHRTVMAELDEPARALARWGLEDELEAVVPGLAEVVAACLHRDPAQRPATAGVLRNRVLALARGLPEEPTLEELVRGGRSAASAGEAMHGGAGHHTLADDPFAPMGGGTLMSEPGDLGAGAPPDVDLLLGREGALAALRAWVGGKPGLLTVTGLGGMGKTWLAARFANERREDGASVLFCDLSEATDLDDLVQAVGGALGMARVGDAEGDGIDALGLALEERGDTLLVLDSFDGLVGPGVSVLARLRRAAGKLRVLVTSRQRLKAPDEVVLALAPLDPESGVALFDARSGVDREGGWTPDDRLAVERLVKNLEGIPLAIALAAGRTGDLSPGKLASVLSTRFLRMRAADAGGPDRQQTLRATLHWSWDRLTRWEQAALAQLSVFRGAFPVPAAEAVVDLSPWPDAPWVPLVIQSLLDRSMLRVVGDGADSGAPRFGMFATVRTFASEHLGRRGALEAPDGRPASGRSAVRSAEIRHGRFFARIGSEQTLDSLHQPGGLRRLRVLLAEREELVAAAERAITRHDPEIAAGAALAALRAMVERGPVDAGLALAGRVLALKGLRPRLRARLLLGRAGAHSAAGSPDAAAEDFGTAITLAQETGLERVEAEALAGAGALHVAAGRLRAARHNLQAALGRFEELGEGWGAARARADLAWVHRDQERPARARPLLDRALVDLRAHGDHLSAADAIVKLGWLDVDRGTAAEARTRFVRALAILRNAGRRAGESEALTGLAVACQDLGRGPEARQLADQAIALARQVGDRPREVHALLALGAIEQASDHPREARANLDLARKLARDGGLPVEEARAAGGLGHLLLASGDNTGAEPLLVGALAAARRMEMPALEAEVSSALGLCLARLGRSGAARAYLRRAEAIFREGDRLGALALHLCRLVEVERLRGDAAAAAEAAREARAVSRRLPPGLCQLVEGRLPEG